MATHNLLALDGGGSWAILQAQALGELYGYETAGQAILDRFTLAAANSGGSIILAGLALNFTPRDLITKLNDQSLREMIFFKNDTFERLMGVEKYHAPSKLTGLRAIMAQAPEGIKCDLPLDQIRLRCRLLIVTFDYDRQRADFFRSDPNSPAASAPGSAQPTLAEAVHASSNAPIKFFDAPAGFETPAYRGRRYWDGAMSGFNNPVMAAVTEALAYGHPASGLRVLSIGTGNVLLPMPGPPLPEPGASGQNNLCVQIEPSGLIHDIKDILPTIILDDPPDQASYVAHLIVSGNRALSQNPDKPVTDGNLVRLNPAIQPVGGPGAWTVPRLIAYAPDTNLQPPNTVPANYSNDAAVFEALADLEIDAVEQEKVDLITTLGRSWIAGAARNQAIRATPDLRPLIGHGTFAAGVAQARALGLAP